MNEDAWPFILGALGFLIAAGVACHAIAYKRVARSAAAWTLLIMLVPLVGVVAYFLFGVNRIERRARRDRPDEDANEEPGRPPASSEDLLQKRLRPSLYSLHNYVSRCTEVPLLGGNAIQLLQGGEEAYPAMLEAIEQAECSISLSTYIFDRDPSGEAFADALGRAVARGVAVRVIVDGVGARYSWPPITSTLRRRKIPVTIFNATWVPWRFRYANLRNHRKILVIDGLTGFTGGINIRAGSFQASASPTNGIADLHAQVEGPVVSQLQQAFASDWGFATGEWLTGPAWFPSISHAGEVFARGLADGPDDAKDPIRTTILGALAKAEKSARIVTPYFLPDTAMISALSVTALRGVEVDIVIPAKNNLLLVQWACDALLWQILERGCRVWKSPPPFDHSKLMVVDDAWTLLGSANWDARSFRLNFEFNLECYDPALGARAGATIQRKIDQARPVTLHDVDQRSFPIRLRDGAARMAAPLL